MAEFLSSEDQIPMVRKALGNPATGDVPDATVAQYIWLAETDLAEMYEFSELRSTEDITTSASTADYLLTEPDILRFLNPAQNITAGIPMKMKDADWDREIGSLFSGDGEPFFFFENGVGSNNRKQVRLRPTPSGVSTIRIPFIVIPTMFVPGTASRSDIPASHTLQVVSRAGEIGLQLLGERSEALKQEKLTAKTERSAQEALPPAAFYVRRLASMQRRMTQRRRLRG